MFITDFLDTTGWAHPRKNLAGQALPRLQSL
jgi:hypothetical protein